MRIKMILEIPDGEVTINALIEKGFSPLRIKAGLMIVDEIMDRILKDLPHVSRCEMIEMSIQNAEELTDYHIGLIKTRHPAAGE
jgi:hypothetical protein